MAAKNAKVEMSAIETEILEAADAKPKKKSESRQEYLHRLVEAVQNVPGDTWETMATETQEWVNAGATAITAGKDIVDFPADVDEVDAEPETDADETDAEQEEAAASDGDDDMTDKQKKTTGKKPAAKKAVVKKAAPAAPVAKKKVAAGTDNGAKRTGAKKPMSLRRAIKLAVIKDPSIKKDALIAHLEKGGFEASEFTVSTTRSETRDTIAILQEHGLLKRNLIA